MLRFDTADEVVVSLDSLMLLVRTNDPSPQLEALISAVETPETAFRSLGQVIAANGFEAPSLVCTWTDSATIYVFLFGSAVVTDTVTGEKISAAGTTTWVERSMPGTAQMRVTWDLPEVTDPAVATAGELLGKPETGAPITSPDADPSQPVDETVEVAADLDVSSTVVLPAAPEALEAPTMPDPNLIGVTDPVSAVPPPPSPTLDLSPRPTPPNASETLDADEVRQQLQHEPQAEAPPQAPSVAAPSAPGPIVASRICPCGVANPLGANACHICGSSMDREGVTIGQAPRPALGTLKFDDGHEQLLAASIVIGRRPPDDHSAAGQSFEPLQVESPSKHVSKAHLEVRLIDWTVNVVDLDSANGTYVDDGTGRPPKKLRPNVVEQLASGETVLFGDRSFRFEAIAGL